MDLFSLFVSVVVLGLIGGFLFMVFTLVDDLLGGPARREARRRNGRTPRE